MSIEPLRGLETQAITILLNFDTGVLITRSDIEIYPAMAPQSGSK